MLRVYHDDEGGAGLEITLEELVAAGYPPEVAVMELHGSGELGQILTSRRGGAVQHVATRWVQQPFAGHSWAHVPRRYAPKA